MNGEELQLPSPPWITPSSRTHISPISTTPVSSTGQIGKPDVKFSKLAETAISIISDERQCALFCRGKKCRYCGYTAWKPHQMAIPGIYSNWITDQILAMARPSSQAIKKFDLVRRFIDAGLTSIINLETPGEHAACGAGLEPSGFSYDPQLFMDNDIFCYNFAWKDFGSTSVSMILDIVKVMEFCLSQGKVAVHCHAGLGRTGVLIACFLAFTYRMSAHDAVHFLRAKRTRCIQTRGQMKRVMEFCKYLEPLRIIFTSRSDNQAEYTLKQHLRRQSQVLHGMEARRLKHIPKIMHVVCERLLALAKGTKSVSSETSSDSSAIGDLSALQQQDPSLFPRLTKNLSHSETDLTVPSASPGKIAERVKMKANESTLKKAEVHGGDWNSSRTRSDAKINLLRSLDVGAESVVLVRDGTVKKDDISEEFDDSVIDDADAADVDDNNDDDDDEVPTSPTFTQNISKLTPSVASMNSVKQTGRTVKDSSSINGVDSETMKGLFGRTDSRMLRNFKRSASMSGLGTMYRDGVSSNARSGAIVSASKSLLTEKRSKRSCKTGQKTSNVEKREFSAKTNPQTSGSITDAKRGSKSSKCASSRLKSSKFGNGSIEDSDNSTSDSRNRETATQGGVSSRKRERREALTVTWALTLDAYTDSVLSRAEEHERNLNGRNGAWDDLASETDPAVLCCIVWHWFDTLKEPVLRVQDLISVLDESVDPILGLSRLEKGARATIEYLLKVLLDLHPMTATLEDRICECLFSHLTHQRVLKSQYTKVTSDLNPSHFQGANQMASAPVSEKSDLSDDKSSSALQTKLELTNEWTPMRGSLTRKLFAFFYSLLDKYEKERASTSSN